MGNIYIYLVMVKAYSKKGESTSTNHLFYIPIGSMYGIYAKQLVYIDGINVTIYSSTMDPMG